MIIESLVRLGKPFVQDAGLTPEEIIQQITDVLSPTAKNFFRNVCVVEIDADPTEPNKVKVIGHPSLICGSIDFETPAKSSGRQRKRKNPPKPKENFQPNKSKVIAIPFTLASGGNKLARQGYYPIASYPVYQGRDKSSSGSLQTMPGNPEEVFRFLQLRAPYTIRWHVTEKELWMLAQSLAPNLPHPESGTSKTMAVIVVIDYRQGIYFHTSAPPPGQGKYAVLCESLLYPGEHIVANLRLIVQNLWLAKLKEGEEKGKIEKGICCFCGSRGYTVSSYAKAWPLFSTTYRYPLPQELSEKELVKSIALCANCYSALVFGANLFSKTVRTLDRTITRELFSPTQSSVGKTSTRQGRKTEDIYGSCYILPVLDEFMEDEEMRQEFIAGTMGRIEDKERSNLHDVQLQNILGFESILPRELADENYRLSVIYYMGDWSRGAVDLIATIQDVIPSVAGSLTDICHNVGDFAVEIGELIAKSWNSSYGDEERTRLRTRHTSLPYNLILAYGGPYLWQTLNSALHRHPLPKEPFIRNTAKRMTELAKDLSSLENSIALRNEVIFYASFLRFLELYRTEITKEGGSVLSNWHLWMRRLKEQSPESWKPDSIEEIGFAAGTVIRSFSRQYYHQTDKKDFIKHRIMTFGSTLRPIDVFSKGLARLSEYARRLDMKVSEELREKAAAISMKYLEMQDEINKNRDAFMAAFWAGYELCPADLYSKRGENANK